MLSWVYMTISKARLASRVQLHSKGPSLNIPKLQLGTEISTPMGQPVSVNF